MTVRLVIMALALLLLGATPVMAESAAYEAGQSDRQAWEQWFDSLTGEQRSGAEFWAGQRSKPNPGSCYGAAGETLGSWTDGCVDAQRRLATTDARRKNEPDYKLGWNHPNDSSSHSADSATTSTKSKSYREDEDPAPRAHAAAEAGIYNIGDCVITKVESAGQVFVDNGGSTISFTNGLFEQGYEQVPGINSSRNGDTIKLCLKSIPKDCPIGDDRGREYITTNLRTHAKWTLSDSRHSCGI